MQFHTLDIDFQFLKGTDLAQNLQRTLFADLRIFTGYGVVSGTKRCFQYTTAGTEDHTGSGCFTERIVKITLRKSGYIDMIGLDETAYLAGSQNIINILSGSGAVHARKSQFALLGHTRHDGNTGDIFRCNAFFLCKISFDDSTEHLLRGLGSGKLRQKLRILALCKADPARAAGGEHWPAVFIRLL